MRASSVASIPAAMHHVLGVDVLAEASCGVLAADEPRDDSREPLAERHDPRVVQVGRDELDEGGRDDRLVDDPVEQVVDRRSSGAVMYSSRSATFSSKTATASAVRSGKCR